VVGRGDGTLLARPRRTPRRSELTQHRVPIQRSAIAFARGARIGADDVGVGVVEHRVEGGSELAVSVADQEPDLFGEAAQRRSPDWACWPVRRGVCEDDGVDVRVKHHVVETGPATGPVVMLAHGFGCDQHMWRLMRPRLAENFRVVTFDLVGSGRSDRAAWDAERYSSLDGYARDVVELCREMDLRDVMSSGTRSAR
jgi:hypothetical protein